MQIFDLGMDPVQEMKNKKDIIGTVAKIEIWMVD